MFLYHILLNNLHICWLKQCFWDIFDDLTGPSPDIDVVLSILLQSSIPTGQTGKPATSLQQMPGGPGPTTSDHSGSIKTRMNNGPPHRLPRDGHSGKRKDLDSMYLQHRCLFLYLATKKNRHLCACVSFVP